VISIVFMDLLSPAVPKTSSRRSFPVDRFRRPGYNSWRK
jgi:hypothetical protein